MFTVLFQYFLQFFRQLHNFIFPKLFIFLSKELFQAPFTAFQGVEIFPLREVCKDWNKWKSNGAMSGEYGAWIRTSQPSCDSFCLVIKETWSWGILMEGYAFSVDSFLTLSVECCFQLLQLGAVLVGINRSFFWKELIKEDSFPIPLYIQHHLLPMKTGLQGGRWWLPSLAPWCLRFHMIVQYPLFITQHNLF